MIRFTRLVAISSGWEAGREPVRHGASRRRRCVPALQRLLALAGFALAVGTANAAILGVHFDKSIYSIDETTAVATLLNANTSLNYSPNAMAKDGAGVVYVAGGGLFGGSALSTVNPTTGVITNGPAINLGGGAVSIRAMAFSPGSVLYAINNPVPSSISPPFQLFTINTGTGVGTFIANVNGTIQAADFSPGGTLYAWNVTNSPNGRGLVTIDTATGAITDVNPAIGGSAAEVQGMAFSAAGVAYGANADLYTINLTTGALSLIGSLGTAADDIRGIAFVAAAPPAPAVSLTPATLNFGNQLVGTTSAAQTLTLQNVGTATLTIASIAASGDFAQTNTCGATLAATASCTISVTFTPLALGVRNGAVSVASNAAGSPHSSALSGTGTAVPPPPTGPVAPIPTLSQWALIVLSLLVGIVALGNRRLRPRQG